MEFKVLLDQDEALRPVCGDKSPVIDVNNITCPICGETMSVNEVRHIKDENVDYYDVDWICHTCQNRMTCAVELDYNDQSVPHQLFRDYKINTFIDACDEKSTEAIEAILGDHAKEIRDAADKGNQKKLDSLAVEIKSEWAGYLSRSDKDFSVKLKIYEDKVMADAEETRKQTKKQKKTKSKKEAAQ